jgi:hypothetical protein
VPVGSPPTGAGELVFRLVEVPGLMPPGESVRMPRLSLYGDGALVLGDVTPRPTSRQLTDAGIRQVVQAAADAGLTSRTDYGTAQLPDAGVAVFTVVTTTRVTTTVAAPAHDGEANTPQREARERLRSFLDRLADLDSWLGNDIGEESRPYAYTRLAVLALPQEADPGAPQQVWPLGDLATVGEPHSVGRCLVVSGAELDPVRAAAAGAAPNTRWRSGDRLFQVVLRPLLPDERTCQDLGE